MALPEWDFILVDRLDYGDFFSTTEMTTNFTEITRDDTGEYGRYRATIHTYVPAKGKTVEDLQQFFRTVRGGALPFKFKDPLTELYYKVTLEAVGTGDGVEDEFLLDMKYIDESTLLVYVDGVLQTLTTHYSVSGNESAPKITFVTPPPNTHAVTATYEFYMPVRFDVGVVQGSWDGAVAAFRHQSIGISEIYPGAHRA